MKRNVTIALDEETARWLRVEAARQDISVASFVADLLDRRMGSAGGYEESMKEFLSRGPRELKGKGTTYPSRDELHDRAVPR